MRVLARSRGLLAAQGYQFITPPPGARIIADVAVMPKPGSPEWPAYEATPIEAGGVIVEEDPWRALSLAVAHPKESFSRVLVGVDPGSECGVSAVADGVVLYAGKEPCEGVGSLVAWLASWIPHARLSVHVGTGPGFSQAAVSLERAGIPYSEADEADTSNPVIPGLARHSWKDKDLRASTIIALLGAYRRGVRR